MSRCPGYGESGKAFNCTGTPGTPWTPVWCPECDERRRARITRQLEELLETFGPVRACCGQRHRTVECPDALVMCCLCFHRVRKDQLHVLDDGSLEDVCIPCTEREESHQA